MLGISESAFPVCRAGQLPVMVGSAGQLSFWVPSAALCCIWEGASPNPSGVYLATVFAYFSLRF